MRDENPYLSRAKSVSAIGPRIPADGGLLGRLVKGEFGITGPETQFYTQYAIGQEAKAEHTRLDAAISARSSQDSQQTRRGLNSNRSPGHE